MSDTKEQLQHARRQFPLPPDLMESLRRRRDRKRRNQRIAAGVVGIAVFVAAVWIVTSVGSVDRSQPAVPGGGETGRTPTPAAGTRPAYLIDINTGVKTPLPESIASGHGFSVSPDGTMVAYVSDDDEGRDQVFIASLDGTDVQQVTHTRGGARLPDFPDWSPDGAAIAYAAAVGDVRVGDVQVRDILVFDLATGETRQVTNEKPPGMGALFPQFSPDGASIVYSVYRGYVDSVRSVPVTGGKSTLLVGGGKNDIEAWLPSFSPNGSLAVWCSGRLEGLCIADADGTNLRELVSVPPVYELYGPEWSPDGTRIAYTIGDIDNSRVFVVDVATGETTFVDEAFGFDWLDDHTLIVEALPPA
jgi:Tol biopolymer transport system component